MAKVSEVPSFDHGFDDVKIVATLMAGVVGTVSYGVDATGTVYILDGKGKPIEEAPESIATKVREQLKRGEKTSGTSLRALMDETDTLEEVNVVVKRISSYKEKLTSIPQNRLTDAQKIWLLACEAAEAKIATGSSESLAHNIFLLDTAIDR